MDTVIEDHDSATYSIESVPSYPANGNQMSVDDVILPTVRRSAVQIVTQPRSSRRQTKNPVTIGSGTMQITKLVLKTPPGSPKRQSKSSGIMIRSIQTLASPGLIGGFEMGHGTDRQKSNVLIENRNVPEETLPYRIVPIDKSTSKASSSQKEFEARRAERERTTNEFQDFLRDSFKENKTPPSTPPLPTVTSVTSAIVVSNVSGVGSSESESKSITQGQNLAKPSIPMDEVIEIVISPVEQPLVQTVLSSKAIVSPPVPAARPSLLLARQKSPDLVPTTAATLRAGENNERLKDASKETVNQEPSILDHPKVETTVEAMKTTRNVPLRLEQEAKPTFKPAIKSTTNAPLTVTDAAKRKEKSYDPARAREFIREQQAKRRQEKTPGVAAGGGTIASEKDLIKQRLETLRQSSQKLVSKNLQKARKRSVSCAPQECERLHKDSQVRGAQNDRQTLRPSTAGPPTTNLRKFASTPALRLNKHPAPAARKQRSSIRAPLRESTCPSEIVLGPTLKSVADPIAKEKTLSSSSSEKPSSKQASTGSSKVGILRKPDSLALEDIVPLSPLKVELFPQPVPISGNRWHDSSSTMVNARLIVINAEEERSIAEAEKELKLDVPEVTLVSSNAVPAAATMPSELPEPHLEKPEEKIHHPVPIKSIPTWLKQSLRQPDPYPFIVAVRKKLEAVRSVREEEEDGKRPTVEQTVRNTASHVYLDAIKSVPYIIKNDVCNIERNDQACIVMAPPVQRRSSDLLADGSPIMTNISPYASSNTTSEFSSLKSDIPPPMPPLLCSTRIEKPNPPNPVTLSPKVPASGPISPLSIERISQMKIPTPTNIPTSPRCIDREQEMENWMVLGGRKNRPVTPPLINTSTNRPSEHADRSQKELEYQRLLDSFNRSLTHVIEVNQQLYSALKNVPAKPAIPPLPQEVLRLRDEMTQTSQPVMVVPKETAAEVASPRSSKTVDQTVQRSGAGGSTTTVSNYSDDFEHQSQTEAPRTPERKTSPPAAGSPITSSTGSSASSSPSSSSDNTSNGSANSSTSMSSSDSSSSTSSSSSSSEAISDQNHHSEQPQMQNGMQSASNEERKARTPSNTTTAQSSDFDSRSFSLSDSHNNTANNHPSMPKEYLPSFEESLRRDKQVSENGRKEGDRERQSKTEEAVASRDGSNISERIDQSNEIGSFSLMHSETMDELKVDASIPRASESDDIVDKSTLKEEQIRVPDELNADATVNSDLLAAVFNRTDLEVSILSTTVSETNLSYSSIGMFDQLISSERSKEEQLVSRVQSKQKALLNRAKGQLAWLELQKQRYREKGMTEHISAIKKKQRAILLRLEKDRAELNRTIKSSKDSSQTGTTRTPLTTKNVDSKLSSYCSSTAAATGNSGSLTLRKSSSSIHSSPHEQRQPRTPGSPQQRQRKITGSTVTTTTSNSIQIAIRGRELKPNDRLEDILLRREAELRKRKEHVQRLLEWHQKLEREEEELLAVEDRLLTYNSRKLERTNTPKKDRSIEARVQSIESSLKILQSIPTRVARQDDKKAEDGQRRSIEASSVNGDVDGDEEEQEVVMTGGSKLNRLWYRLTGIKERRYEPERNYPITRPHLEALYEDAKRCVLEGFQRNDGQLEEELLERSIDGRKAGAGETTMTTTESVEGNVSLQTIVDSEETVRVVVQETERTLEENEKISHATTIVEPTDILPMDPTDSELHSDGMEVELQVENAGRYLLSSTINEWSPGSRKSVESVEFHTLEETGTNFQSAREASVEEEPARSDSYSMTFEEHSNVADHDPDASQHRPAVGEDSQPMIEDMSLPSMLLNNTSVMSNEDETGSSSCESSVTVELSMPLLGGSDAGEKSEMLTDGMDELDQAGSDGSISIGQSLEEATVSSVSTCVTTPTTVTPTLIIEANVDDIVQPQPDGEGEREEGKEENVIEEMEIILPEKREDTEATGSDFEVEEDDLLHLKSSRASSRNDSPGSCTSELEKRLATLHDELEELSESFERTPLMKSPSTPSPVASMTKASLEDRTSTEDTITFEEEKEDDSAVASSSGSNNRFEGQEKGKSGTEVVVANVTTCTTLDPDSVKVEIKLPSKTTIGEMLAITAGTGTSNRDYPAPPAQARGEATSALGGTSPPLSPPAVVRMPDIINEAEVLRRQQLQIEQEIKELEQQVGFFREIPNKPPPPYIPPANGSPLALLFPCEARIDELIDRRVEELHRDRIAPERLRSEHVTNVYEKLILDMCKELYRELRPADPTVSFRTITHDKRPLVFYNPPDPLRCMKDFLRAKVRRVLNEEQLALLHQHQHQHQQQQQLLLHHHQLQQLHQQQHPQHAALQHQHLLHHCATMPFLFANGGCASKRKRDQVDEILAQEMHDDDTRWTNFDREEVEVKDRITDELLKSLLAEALHDMAEAYESKGKGKKHVAAEKLESAM